MHSSKPGSSEGRMQNERVELLQRLAEDVKKRRRARLENEDE